RRAGTVDATDPVLQCCKIVQFGACTPRRAPLRCRAYLPTFAQQRSCTVARPSWRRWLRRWYFSAPQQDGLRPRGQVLMLERLEERVVPSTVKPVVVIQGHTSGLLTRTNPTL